MFDLGKHTLYKITFLVAIISATIWLITQILPSSNDDNRSNSGSTSHQSNIKKIDKPAIATLWQWDNVQSATKEQSSTAGVKLLPFTAESVYNALQAVKVDESGNVILNHDTLISLDEALERIYNRLDSESLSTLQSIIKDALPGITGEQTAKLVEDYQQFLQAKDEFSRINENQVNTSGKTTLETIGNDQALYGELQALREVYLGKEVTSSLFRVSDANAIFMFESMKLEYDTSLAPEVKEKKRQEIQDQHLEQSINIDNWPERYKTFNSAKELIVSSSITKKEMRIQLSDLVKQHFDNEELKRIEHIGLDQL